MLRNVPTVVDKKYTVTEIHVWNHSWRCIKKAYPRRACRGNKSYQEAIQMPANFEKFMLTPTVLLE